jgi:CRISPR-associated endoribonuclease Cas6
MRIKINFTPNNEVVPISNQQNINSYIHRCLGRNNQYHDSKSDYCISHLYGGKLCDDKKTLNFENGGIIIITSKNETFLNTIIKGIMLNPELKWGMKFKSIDFISEEFQDGWNHFFTLSPFIIKEYSEMGKYTFLTLDDENFDDKVTEHVKRKLLKMDDTLNLNDFKISISKTGKEKIKQIFVKNVVNKANQCNISIFCSSKIAEMIYNTGIGQSTGSGFGTIYKTENHNKYKVI